MAVRLDSQLDAPPRVHATYGTRVEPAWRYDVRAIERAMDYFELRGRVRLYLSECRSRRWVGSAHYDTRADEHVVMVARWLTPEAASETIWHELTHCAQVERGEELYTSDATSLSARARVARQSREAYDQLPGEREAHQNERLADTYPLVRAIA